jgi:hypothetical protein
LTTDCRYYTLTDLSAVYDTGVELHPGMKMDYFQGEWKDRPEWVSTAEDSVRMLWESNYKGAASLQTSDNLTVQVPIDSSPSDIGLTAWQRKR